MTKADDLFSQVLGVVDLKAGYAVHAIAGQRNQYMPVDCPLTRSGSAIDLASGYLKLGVGGLYVADLDAIEHGYLDHVTIIEALADLKVPVWLDAGTVSDIFETLPSNVQRVVGTESLVGWDEFPKFSANVLSVDLRGGLVQSPAAEIRECSAVEVIQMATSMGIEKCIVLELSSVGTSLGPGTVEICKQIQAAEPGLQIASGGGIRTLSDVRSLENAGCEYFLIGTALHNGRNSFQLGT